MNAARLAYTFPSASRVLSFAFCSQPLSFEEENIFSLAAIYCLSLSKWTTISGPGPAHLTTHKFLCTGHLHQRRRPPTRCTDLRSIPASVNHKPATPWSLLRQIAPLPTTTTPPPPPPPLLLVSLIFYLNLHLLCPIVIFICSSLGILQQDWELGL